MAGLGGLATAGVIVGGAWVLNATGTYIDKQPIDPPARVGAYLRYDKLDVRASGRPDIQQKILEQNAKSSELLSQAHGGAAAVVQLYAGRDLRQQLSVQIYRAPSAHPLYVPYEDYQRYRLAKPTQSAEEFGEVSCVVRNDPTPAGQPPGPNGTHTSLCSRTNKALTVEVRPIGDLADQPDDVAALVDSLWNAIT